MSSYSGLLMSTVFDKSAVWSGADEEGISSGRSSICREVGSELTFGYVGFTFKVFWAFGCSLGASTRAAVFYFKAVSGYKVSKTVLACLFKCF